MPSRGHLFITPGIKWGEAGMFLITLDSPRDIPHPVSIVRSPAPQDKPSRNMDRSISLLARHFMCIVFWHQEREGLSVHFIGEETLKELTR